MRSAEPLERRVGQQKPPLRPVGGEADDDLAAVGDADDDALAELVVTHAVADRERGDLLARHDPRRGCGLAAAVAAGPPQRDAAAPAAARPAAGAHADAAALVAGALTLREGAGHLDQELRGHGVAALAEDRPLARQRERQPLARAGDRDVEEPPLLLKVPVFER